MHVNSITNAANLKKLYDKYPKTIGQLACRYDMQLMLGFSYLAAWDINIGFKSSDSGKRRYFTMDQIGFFKFIDLCALLRLRYVRMQAYAFYYSIQDLPELNSESYWDPYDVQPFRESLFVAGKAIQEFSIITHDLGITKDTCMINNYTNCIEYDVNSFTKLMQVFSNWAHNYETVVESLGGC